MAYQSNLLGDFWRGYRQRRIGSGMPLSQNEIGGLLGPILASDAEKARTQGLLDEQRRRFDLQRKDQKMASKVGGVGQLLQLPIAYGAAESMGWFGGATAQEAVAPAAASSLGAQGLTTGVAGAGGTAAPAAVAGAGAAGAESAGLLATAAPFAAAGGAGLLGGALLGPTLDKILPGGGKTGKAVGGAAGGALVGAAAGSVVPGVGTVVGGLIGGAIGAISSLF